MGSTRKIPGSNITPRTAGPFPDATLAAFAYSSWFVRLPLDDEVQTSPGSIEMWFTFPSGNTADRELFDEKEKLERGVGRHTGELHLRRRRQVRRLLAAALTQHRSPSPGM
ncbi:MAG TPA: hypothetical protein VFV01_10925 [Spirillospora sp.]|nr:hypothetical protein [Spirillospora sp.]